MIHVQPKAPFLRWQSFSPLQAESLSFCGSMSYDTWRIVCITGIGCSGKTTLAKKVQARIPGSLIVHQDDYFWPRDYEGHVPAPGMEVEVSNWEIVSCINFDRLFLQVESILHSSASLEQQVLIIEGHLVLNEPRINSIADLKICLTMSKEQCWERRQHKYYGTHDSLKYFNVCAWPEYQSRLREITKFNDRCVNEDAKIQFIDYGTDFDELSNRITADVRRINEIKVKNCQNKECQ